MSDKEFEAYFTTIRLRYRRAKARGDSDAAKADGTLFEQLLQHKKSRRVALVEDDRQPVVSRLTIDLRLLFERICTDPLVYSPINQHRRLSEHSEAASHSLYA